MKKLITANDIRDAKAKSIKEIAIKAGFTIVTPEAYDVAKTFGISLIEEGSSSIPIKPNEIIVQKDSSSTPPSPKQQTLYKIKNEIQSRVGSNVESDLIESLIKKAMADFNVKAPTCPRQINDDGIVLVRGNSVELDAFDGAPGKNIGLTDVIGTAQNSTLGVGYMGWEKAFFPWTLNYDEVDVVLEGELHIKTPSGTTIGKPGDVIFIPKGSSIEFGTPTHVRFVYVAYPADWSEQ